jgi:hypothetical protein
MGFFDAVAGEAGKREGMERAEASANAEFKATMIEIGVQLARTLRRYTTDEMYEIYYAMDHPPPTHEHRVMGPIMSHLAKHHVIIQSTMWKESRRPSQHRRPLRVWTSLIYNPSA